MPFSSEIVIDVPRRTSRIIDSADIRFEGIDRALEQPDTALRLFGKPESFVKRRMGVALAFDADVEVARTNAKRAAALVKPRAA